MINKSRLSNYLFISKQPVIYFYHIQIFYIYSLEFFRKELRNNNLIFLYNNFSCSPIATETLQKTIKMSENPNKGIVCLSNELEFHLHALTSV